MPKERRDGGGGVGDEEGEMPNDHDAVPVRVRVFVWVPDADGVLDGVTAAVRVALHDEPRDTVGVVDGDGGMHATSTTLPALPAVVTTPPLKLKGPTAVLRKAPNAVLMYDEPPPPPEGKLTWPNPPPPPP